MPRWTTLTLASLIILGGVWLSNRGPDRDSRAAERKRLITRRDKLFTELVRLEHDRRTNRVNQARYEARRQELVAALESIYGSLDSDDMDPGPDRSGLAA